METQSTGTSVQTQTSNLTAEPSAPIGDSPAVPAEKPAQESTQVSAQDDFNAKFTALSKKEKAIWLKEQELKQKYGDYEQIKGKYTTFQSRIKENPLEVLESEGWDYKKLTDFVLNDNKKTPEHRISELQAKLEALENDRKADMQRREQENLLNVENSYKNQIRDHVKSNDLFGTIGDEGINLVYNVIEKHYQDTDGEEIMDISEAVKQVEAHYEKYIEPLLKVDRFKNLAQKLVGIEKEVPKNTTQTSPTLTNQSATTSNSGNNSGYMTNEESLAWMIRQAKELNAKKSQQK